MSGIYHQNKEWANVTTPNPAGTASTDLTKLGIDGVNYNVKDANAAREVQETITEAQSRANLADGDSVPTIFGKIKKWFSDLKTVAFTGAYSDLSGTPTIPTVNDGTLTIQKNGTAVETFTANSSTNKTANITVPTKTSDLTNDSGFVTTDEKVTGDEYNNSSGIWNNVPFIGISNQKPYYNDGLRDFTKNGTANTVGRNILATGNSIASGTEGNKRGEIWFFGENTKRVNLMTSALTADREVYLPNKDGTVALTSDVPSTYAGSSTAGGSATSAESLSTSGTERDYWRGDNTWSNEYKGNLYSGGINALGKSDVPYHEIAKFEQTTNGAQINTSIQFLVKGFYNPRSAGILSIDVRFEVNGTSPTFLLCKWLVADSAIDPSSFIATWIYNSSTKIVTIKLYVKATGWSSHTFTRLAENAWGVSKTEWTLNTYGAGQGVASIPAGETQVVSTLSDIINNITDSTKLPLAGGTMTGQLKTSFKESVAMGSLDAVSTNIPDLCNELRYSSGCCGSAYITTAYNGSPSSVGVGWYNFLWIPHRSGGVNGSASGDNCNYGRLILRGMTVNGEYEIRFNSGSIAYCRELISAANIGSQSVDKATKDGDGNTISSTYAKKPLYATGSVSSGKTGVQKIAQITLSEVGTYYITGWAKFTGGGKKAVQLWCAGTLGESWEDSTIASGEPKTFSTFAIYTSTVANEDVKVNSYTVSASNAVTGGLVAIKLS